MKRHFLAVRRWLEDSGKRLRAWGQKEAPVLFPMTWGALTLIGWGLLVPIFDVFELDKPAAAAALDTAMTLAVAGAAVIAVIDLRDEWARNRQRPDFAAGLEIEYPPKNRGSQAKTGLVDVRESVAAATAELKIPEGCSPVLFVVLTNVGTAGARYTAVRVRASVQNHGRVVLVPHTPTTWHLSQPTEDEHVTIVRADTGDAMPSGWEWGLRVVGIACPVLNFSDLPWRVEVEMSVIADGMAEPRRFRRAVVFVQGPP